MNYHSWGLYPKSKPAKILKVFWRTDIPLLSDFKNYVLPFAYGRSYGDVCLNNGEMLIDVTYLKHFIYYNRENGIIRCEAGTSLSEILKLITPDGWFLPVTPGTKYISVAGAIANDVHGKNHHSVGSFGRFIRKFELLRSDGKRYLCSREYNSDLFYATIGGLGLTGIITWVEISLQKIPGSFLLVENYKFSSLEEYFHLNNESNQFEYTVAWVDFSSGGKGRIRGIYERANFVESPFVELMANPKFKIPFLLPFSLINAFTVFSFNTLYFTKQLEKINKGLIHFDTFFYPLDKVANWNRIYGRNGFIQYQFVIPDENAYQRLENFFNYAKKLNLYSFLAVMKNFGNKSSGGLLSFPRKGITLAIDFPITKAIFKKLEILDKLVLEAGGAFYPAKDARMSSEAFLLSFGSRINNFLIHKDPKFSSSFWRRVFPYD
ncbi:MAG: FAD-binding protein [Candidatus Kapaibacteriales bacterium]